MSVGRSWKKFWRDAAIAGVAATASCALAAIGHDYWQQWHNMRALQTLTTNAIRQAEYNIDYAILASFEVVQRAPEPCIPEGQRAIQSIIHAGSNIKDVLTLNAYGKTLCSAFPESGQQWVISPGTPTRNDDFALHRLSGSERDSLGVSWKADDVNSTLIALDLDAQLYAALPADIRDDARNSLIVMGIGEIASFGRAVDPQNSVFVTSSSDRFPVTTTLTLDNACFKEWNGEDRTVVMLLGAVLGLLLAGLLIRELRRPLSPRQQLQQAINNNEIQPFAQATFDLASREVTGCEVLMRWIKPCGEVVSPALFIPLAEATNMIVPMTRHVMRAALVMFEPLMNKKRDFKVAFNVVPMDFVSQSFAEEMLQLTKRAGVATRQVMLEMTERQAMADAESLREAVARVRDLGFKVALDDMGTGHNGLSSVQDVPLDVIKIDKKFVDAVGQEAVADAIIEMLVGLADRLKLKTTAEGIETETQRLALLKAGVTCGQGYLVGKPVHITEFLRVHAGTQPQTSPTRAKEAA
jgi:sensor c-di-GMP phosphodiesterase-like protein